MGLTPVCVKTCVLLKINHFLQKNAFSIKSWLRNTFSVLNCVFHYFVLKVEFSWVLSYFLLRPAFR